ncbi:hypothetical protein YW7DRAFT_05992 [Streptomyces sp. AmelKG-E11A]|nr:hypothetical protein YW7DRAFT_05992 [Streptomyces sp. AmelKG-E11A]
MTFRRRMGQVARNPYGFGNPVDGIEDRRQAVVAGTITLYWISRSVLTISVVKVVHTG